MSCLKIAKEQVQLQFSSQFEYTMFSSISGSTGGEGSLLFVDLDLRFKRERRGGGGGGERKEKENESENKLFAFSLLNLIIVLSAELFLICDIVSSLLRKKKKVNTLCTIPSIPFTLQKD